ncbi:MAG: outer membrane lipid asymmetry maintenance protein MlaD [Deferribacterota bacterium]|nr:outer membrane lipid asymmetry maintenance protein MlaD [Deferribacterota bacterium]
MNNRYKLEVLVGIFVLIGLLAVGYLTLRLGQVKVLGGNYYDIKARFSDVGGLKIGNEVQVSGVVVGRVEDIKLNPNDYSVIITMNILKNIKLSDDTMALIKTNGLIGDRYISLLPGGSPITLQGGDIIVDTQPPVDIEELISKYVFGDVSKNNNKE